MLPAGAFYAPKNTPEGFFIAKIVVLDRTKVTRVMLEAAGSEASLPLKDTPQNHPGLSRDNCIRDTPLCASTVADPLCTKHHALFRINITCANIQKTVPSTTINGCYMGSFELGASEQV